ncbi:class E sortase [Streptomyces sp. ST2-7A]|uniref:class E sortase n=1 Tax=Streptomyces sp. ST2-7A TaxID=2907214 RepID=UPI001F3DD4BD|nr:class E sortase [Streptomyces sp. ST2-7A]MCE7080692.1 class E sortase [Streptomyces sp. ST2-7A]
MTAVRPERDGGTGKPGSPQVPPAGSDTFRAAVDALSDPLNDPLPGTGTATGDGGTAPVIDDRYESGPPVSPGPADPSGAGPGTGGAPYGTTGHEAYGTTAYGASGSDGYGSDGYVSEGYGSDGYGAGGYGAGGTDAHDTDARATGVYGAEPYGSAGHGTSPYRDETSGTFPGDSPGPSPGHPASGHPGATGGSDPYGTPYDTPTDPYGADARSGAGAPTPAFPTPADPYMSADPYASAGAPDETMALRRPADLRSAGNPSASPATVPDRSAGTGGRRRTAPGSTGTPETRAGTGAGEGRAARRKAEKARRSSRANTFANVAGELMMTTGVLLLLFVTYQLWWTNVEARAHADREADSLADLWEGGSDGEETDNRDPGVFSAGEGFALLYLPTLDVRVPVAESVDEATVLDKGMVGRYSEADRLPTAMPWDDEGNFGLAGHRNTHGEPFRYINLLNEGDPIIVETETTYYIYEMRSRLDSTSPSNITVLDPIPEQGGFTEPGRYITLTTCTPEFTSTFRLIVWGEMVAEQPRGEGKPDALVA